MRTIYNTSFILLLLAVFVSCKEKQSVEINTPAEIKQKTEKTADIADVEFMDGLTGKLWHNYLQIKMALTESDSEQVQQTADSMTETLTEELVVLKSLTLEISETDNIEAQRELFARLTEEIGPLFEDALSGGTIYKKRCPMAFDNKGAFWYADIEEISNPYFGEKMPNCGSVVKTISKEQE
jgi:hypothetical protein